MLDGKAAHVYRVVSLIVPPLALLAAINLSSEPSRTVVLAAALLSTGAVHLADAPMSKLWQTVTPVRDRVTVWESSVVQLLSILAGLFALNFLVIFGEIWPALRIAMLATVIAAPAVGFQYWMLRTLGGAEDTILENLPPGHRAAVEPTIHARGRAWRNLLAIVIAGTCTSATLSLCIMGVFIYHDVAFHAATIAHTFGGGALAFVIIAYPNLALGRWLLRGFQGCGPGVAYTVGAASMMAIGTALCAPSLAASSTSALSFVIAGLILLPCFGVGGWALGRLWTERSAADVFA